jgi:DNA-dependent protein kinase catalytic subunit
MLPVPEMVPFRLTAQMVNIFRPLDAEGLLKHSMVHALTALRESKDVLLNVMAVFVQEPLLDWATYARRLADTQKAAGGGGGGADKSDDGLWYPRKRIEIATHKLEGWNPAAITEQELRESTQAARKYLPQIIRIARGDATENVRAKAKDKCVSVKEQVDCLVDQATDPAILGRAWVGWGPFL